MEGILTYVEDQNATLHATPRVAMPPDVAPAVIPTQPPPTQHCQCTRKIIRIPDPPTFHASEKDRISYEDWHLQMINKMSANESTMPTEALKLAYIQSLTADNAFAQIKPRLGLNATRPFATASEMFEVLTAAFGNAFCKQEARIEYRSLRQGSQDFSTFWAEFQRLAAELDHLEATLIDNLIEKCNYTI